nr:nucleotidyltransferase family protein [Rhabdobacter roseus]
MSRLVQVCLQPPGAAGAATPVDSERLLALASWHGVRPLLFSSLRAESTPASVYTHLQTECQEIAVANLLQTRELLRLVQRLASHQVPSYAYKGSLWASWLYGNQSLREQGDIDLLVPRPYLDQALALLTQDGYLPDAYRQYLLERKPGVKAAFLRTDYHIPLVWQRAAAPESVLEVHWRVAYPRLCFEFPEQEWEAMAEDYPLQKGTVTSFRKEYQLLLIITHHGGKEQWLRLKYLADLAAYLRRYGAQTDWAWVGTWARRKGMYSLLQGSLALLKSLGMEWNAAWPETEAKPLSAAQLQSWESMAALPENSTWPYLRHALQTRDGAHRLKVLLAHARYASEWYLLYHKALWYRQGTS